jgi:hypothetical protein
MDKMEEKHSRATRSGSKLVESLTNKSVKKEDVKDSIRTVIEPVSLRTRKNRDTMVKVKEREPLSPFLSVAGTKLKKEGKTTMILCD